MAKVIVKYPEVSFFQFFGLHDEVYFKKDFTLPLYVGKSDELVMDEYNKLIEMGYNVALFEMNFIDASIWHL